MIKNLKLIVESFEKNHIFSELLKSRRELSEEE